MTLTAVTVRLTPEEVEFAATAGATRRARAISRGLDDRYGQVDTDPWRHDIEGVAAELAVAKTLGRYYIPALHVQSGTEGDVAHYQVRSTEHANGCLLVKDGDRDEDVFVLVVGSMPKLTVVGWMRASEGKLPEWRRNVRGREAWFVPQSALHPMGPAS
jgi:hypothetical protein